MTRDEIKKRYTLLTSTGKWARVQFMVVPQYFTVFETDEGRDHAEHFQNSLVSALEKMQMEMTHDVLNELEID